MKKGCFYYRRCTRTFSYLRIKDKIESSRAGLRAQSFITFTWQFRHNLFHLRNLIRKCWFHILSSLFPFFLKRQLFLCGRFNVLKVRVRKIHVEEYDAHETMFVKTFPVRNTHRFQLDKNIFIVEGLKRPVFDPPSRKMSFSYSIGVLLKVGSFFLFHPHWIAFSYEMSRGTFSSSHYYTTLYTNCGCFHTRLIGSHKPKIPNDNILG